MKQVYEIIKEELDCLDYAIIYAENNACPPEDSSYGISTDVHEKISNIRTKQKAAYEEFLRVAWGKEIRIVSSVHGEMVYRLTQSAAVVPNINLATPSSPIGKLVNVARVGFASESSQLGDYEVKDVRFFYRYLGPDFWQQRKNFRGVTSEGKKVFKVKDAISWLKGITDGQVEHPPDRSNTAEQDIKLESEAADEKDEEADWLNLVQSLEEEYQEEIDEPDNILENDLTSDSISLSSRFYINLTEQQYEASHCGPQGLVYVFGVAGSGKTSVALGRSKSLVQLGQGPDSEQGYNPDFPEESQVGVVKTSELITYLKKTCNDLYLHRIPIVEYRDIYEELRYLWDIEQQWKSDRAEKRQRAKYLLTTIEVGGGYEETGEWLNVASQAMISILEKQILAEVQQLKGFKDPSMRHLFSKVSDFYLTSLREVLKNKEPLEYISRIEKNINDCNDKIFNKSVWIGIPGEEDTYEWIMEPYEDVSAILKRKTKPLVLIDDELTHDKSIVVPDEYKKDWIRCIPGEARGVDPYSEDAPNRLSFINYQGQQISCRLIFMSDEDIRRYTKMGQIGFYSGLGQKNIFIRAKRMKILTPVSSAKHKSYSEEFREEKKKVQEEVRKIVRRRVGAGIMRMRPADLYLEALESLAQSRPDHRSSFLSEKKEQVKKGQLTRSDIDVLLVFMAKVTRNMQSVSDGRGRSLGSTFVKPLAYRSSVFIDEVQDFTEVQVALLTLLSHPKYNSVTAVGDPAQCLKDRAAMLKHSVPKQMWINATKVELSQNIRQSENKQLLALSSIFRNEFVGDSKITYDNNFEAGSLFLGDYDDFKDQVRAIYRKIENFPGLQSIAVVAPDQDWAEAAVQLMKPHLEERLHKDCGHSNVIDLEKKYMIHVTEANNIKGLEFDHLVLFGAEKYDMSIQKDINSLYVCMSRPYRSFTLIGSFGKMDARMKSFLQGFQDSASHVKPG